MAPRYAELCARLPEIPWGQIVNTRNRLVHHYFKIDLDILWDVIQIQLPVLIEVLSATLPPKEEM